MFKCTELTLIVQDKISLPPAVSVFLVILFTSRSHVSFKFQVDDEQQS